jgi:hypothetical protein
MTVGRTAICLVIVSCIGLCAGRGQEGVRPAGDKAREPTKGGDAAGAKEKRAVYFVKHGSAKDLAGALAKHFKGEAEVQVLPDSGNCLLIRAAPPAVAEVVKLLGRLDRRPQLVSVEVLIADVVLKGGAGGKPGPAVKPLDEREFTGPAKDVLAKVEALRTKGQIGGLRRIQLASVEGLGTSAGLSESKPYVTGVRVAPMGLVSKSIFYSNIGTSVGLTVRVASDKAVQMDLHVNDRRARVPEDGIVLGKDEDGATIRATEFITANLNTKLSVASGQAVAAQGVKTDSKSGPAQTLMIVTARVVDPDARADQ